MGGLKIELAKELFFRGQLQPEQDSVHGGFYGNFINAPYEIVVGKRASTFDDCPKT